MRDTVQYNVGYMQWMLPDKIIQPSLRNNTPAVEDDTVMGKAVVPR